MSFSWARKMDGKSNLRCLTHVGLWLHPFSAILLFILLCCAADLHSYVYLLFRQTR